MAISFLEDDIPLPPDDLGEVGESLFRKLCSQARLTCNKSDRDRTGWDFRVEFPLVTDRTIPLDQRTPRACLVQLKSTAAESGTRVSASLSSIERLAKDPGPSVVIILRLRPDGSELMGYAIHLLDDELSRILHRLRSAQADGRHDVNHLKVTFDYLRGLRFRPTPEGLRQALVEICGNDAAAYGHQKRQQLANLGYEDGGGIEAEALVWIESPQHLTRMLSGLAPLKPERITAFDRRFDVRVPYQGTLLDGVEEFNLTLPHAGTCDIIIRNGPLNPAALFRCEAFVPPPIEGGPLLVFRHPTLATLFTHDGLELETVGNIDANRFPLDQWILLLRALRYIAGGTGTVELEFGGVRLSPIRVPSKDLDGPNLDQLPALLEFLERWQSALNNAGAVAEHAFTIGEIYTANVAAMSLDMIFNTMPVARLEIDIADGLLDDDQIEALYFNTIEFAGTTITFATKARLRRGANEGRSYESTGFELLDIRPGVVNLEAYGSEMATVHGIAIVMDPRNMIPADLTEPSRPIQGSQRSSSKRRGR